MVSLQIRISSFKFIGNLSDCNVQFKRQRRGDKCKAQEMLTSMIFTIEAIYWYGIQNKQYQWTQIGSRFGKKLVSTFFWRNMFLSSTLIRSVSNGRSPWKHSSLNPVSQTWVSTVRLVSEPEEMLTSLSLFHNMRINNSILIAKSRCTGSKMCTNLINLLIDSARLVFVCLAPHLCEKQTSPSPFLHSFFFDYSNFDHLKILSRDNFYFLIAVITWYLFHQMNI